MKRVLVVLVVALLAMAFEEAFLAKVAMANFTPNEIEYSEPPTIELQSPLNGAVFPLDNVSLAFTITKPDVGRSGGWIDDSSLYAGLTSFRNGVIGVSVELDGQPDYSVMEVNSLLSSPFNSSLNLGGLEDGEHSVRVHASCRGVMLWAVATSGGVQITSERSISYNASSRIVYFAVDITAPTVSILSVENKTYWKTDLPLDFMVGESSVNLMYCLDGRENVTLAGNATVINLEYGDHTLTVYAWDEAGNVGASETITFTVTTFPTSLVAVAVITLAVLICLGLVAYFLLHKKRSDKA
jgi:hypothetical protein